jgi:hypothetical protein
VGGTATSKLKLKRASPAKKLKLKKIKKVRPAPKGASVKNSTPPTAIDLQIQARKAFPIEHGDGGSERRARERDIAILHEKLVRQRDGETSEIKMGVETSAQETNASADESGPETRPLAKTFSSDTFKGPREGHSFKLGSKGMGCYSDTKKLRNSNKAQEQEITTVAETDSDSDKGDGPPSTPSSVSEHADDFSQRKPGECIAAMRMRLDNERWDARGRPHPQSGFQVGIAPPSSASSNSPSSFTLKPKKKLKARALRKSKTKNKISESGQSQT